jgi:phosphatidylserine decarboxylase
MKDGLIVSLLSIFPRKRGAWFMGVVARAGLSRLLQRWFVRTYGLDMSEAEHPIEHYPTLEALFTRKLRAGVRPIDTSADVIVSPADAAVAFAGRSVGGAVEVAPGRRLVLADLLGEPVDGEHDVAVLYLSPKDYHRVHQPREGRLDRWRYLPGTLWPVFPAAVRKIDNLFAKNERAWVRVVTDRGPLWSVMVGAYGVGRITLDHTDLVTNTGGPAQVVAPDPAFPVTRGAPLGTFHLGSTVVLVAPPGRWAWTIRAGDLPRVGRPIARAVS